jgi:hypothetical protein
MYTLKYSLKRLEIIIHVYWGMYRFLVLFSSTIFIIVSLQNAFATLASFVNYDYCEFLLRT